MNLLFGYFHSAIMGHWRDVNAELLNAVGVGGSPDGLLLNTVSLEIGVVGSIEHFLLPYQANSVFAVHDLGKLEEYEYITQQMMYHDCCDFFTDPDWKKSMGIENDNVYVYYFCNAGVSHPPNHDHYPEWRNLMTHYNLTHWKDCVAKLDEGYDTVGVEWQTDPVPHWSGNFWWATAEYIASLPSPEEMKTFDAGCGISSATHPRHGAEFWIGQNPDVKHHSFFQSGYSWRDRPRKNWLNANIHNIQPDH